MTEPAVSVEELLAHRDWARGLARRLVLDDGRADDLAQETWLAALRADVRGATPRAWLATVLRRGAGRMRRTDARRGRREAVAIERDAVAESPLDTVARAEAHENVVRAVMSLEDPYRTAVLLRFFDDLPPRDVAKRTGVPVETARSRVRTGLERVRARLEERHGGAWRAALAPLVLIKKGGGASTGLAAATGGAPMGAKTLAVVVGLAAVGGGLGWTLGAARADEALTAATRRADAASEDARRASEEANALRGRLEQSAAAARDLEKRLRALAAERDAAAASSAADAAGPASAPAAEDAKGPPFAFPQYAVLDSIDWKSMGRLVADALPAAAGLVAASAKDDKTAAMKWMTRVELTQSALMRTIDPLEGKLPGTGPMGAFTSPAVLVNAAAATLTASGHALSADQTGAVERIARDFVLDEERRVAGYLETTFALRREIDEGDLRRRLVEALRAALTPEQRAVLWPEDLRDRGGLDLFSDGYLLGALCRPILWAEMDDLVESTTSDVLEEMHLGAERRAAVRAVVATWAQTLPASALEAKDDPSRPADVTAQLMRESLPRTLALYERVVVDLALGGEAAATARRALAGYMLLRSGE